MKPRITLAPLQVLAVDTVMKSMNNLGTFSVVLFAIYFCVSCGNGSPKTFSEPEMRKLIASEIPEGSSKQEVNDFLNKREIECTEQTPYIDRTSDGEDLDWIVCAIQQKAFFYNNYKVMLEFYFDRETHKLVRYVVKNNRRI